MRELNEEERATLDALEDDLPTGDLLHMASELVEILRNRAMLSRHGSWKS